MSSTSEDTLNAVIPKIWSNQQKEVDGEEENYIRGLAEETNRKPETVARAIDFLERWGLAKTWKRGSKRLVRLTWDVSKSENERLERQQI